MQATDFLSAAAAAAPLLARSRPLVGTVIRDAIDASVAVTGCNTNLGIVLLAAPLIRAALLRAPAESLHGSLCRTLRALSVSDAEAVFQAIRIASPGGLGRSDAHDVAHEPTATLLEIMRVASVRDRIALQYARDYCDVFDLSLPLLREYRDRWQSLSWACVGVYLGLLHRHPDTHIERKFGSAKARAVSVAAGTLESGLKACENPATFAAELKQFDRELKEDGVNPGTSADLTVASVLALLLEHAEGTNSPLHGADRIGRRANESTNT